MRPGLRLGWCATRCLCGCLCLVAGCALASGSKASVAKTSPKGGLNLFGKPAGETASKVAAGPSATLQPRAPATETAAKPSVTKDTGATAAAKPDIATAALIDSELRDATPEERAKYLEYLRDVPPDMIPKILSARRMTLQHTQRTSEPKVDPVVQTAQATTIPPATRMDQAASFGHAASTSTAATPAPANAQPQPGLGQASPWTPGAKPDVSTAAAGTQLPIGMNGLPSPAGSLPPASATNAVTLGREIQPEGTSLPGTTGSTAAAPVGGLRSVTQFASAGLSRLPEGGLGHLIPGYFGGKGAAAQDGGIQRVGLEVNAPAANAGGISLNPGTGVVAGASGVWTEQLQQLTATAESEVAKLTPGPSENERQVYIERHVYLRMLYLMAGQQERALQYIPGIDPADQEFWQQVFWGTANYFDRQGIQNAADRAAQTTAQFNAAVLRLKEKANLELRNLSFCHTISSFGNYERYPRDEFSPGQPVLLYAELANFHCELTTDGRYRTLVRSSIEIYKPGAQGELIEKIEYRPTEDVCRNHRRDYFHSYQIDVPRKLALGPHVMKLTIEDQLSQKVATSSLNFMVK